jgi:hypothetical protein
MYVTLLRDSFWRITAMEISAINRFGIFYICGRSYSHCMYDRMHRCPIPMNSFSVLFNGLRSVLQSSWSRDVHCATPQLQLSELNSSRFPIWQFRFLQSHVVRAAISCCSTRRWSSLHRPHTSASTWMTFESAIQMASILMCSSAIRGVWSTQLAGLWPVRSALYLWSRADES